MNDTVLRNDTNRDNVRKVAEDFMMEEYHELKKPYQFKNIDVQISGTECIRKN